jgi:hypothetical protein
MGALVHNSFDIQANQVKTEIRKHKFPELPLYNIILIKGQHITRNQLMNDL